MTALTSAALACVAPSLGFAQDNYPSRPIEMVIPFAAGGTSDLIGRIVAKALSERLKTPVVVVNRAGAAGTLGMRHLAAAPADGYTIGIGGTTNLAISPYLMSPSPYDPIKDFTALAVAATAPFILVTSPQANFKSMGDLIATAKNKPGQLNFGSSGVGSSHHVMTDRKSVV
jgi:tripartite-type tricarboxylate transporter receptor subunit TctC